MRRLIGYITRIVFLTGWLPKRKRQKVRPCQVGYSSSRARCILTLHRTRDVLKRAMLFFATMIRRSPSDKVFKYFIVHQVSWISQLKAYSRPCRFITCKSLLCHYICAYIYFPSYDCSSCCFKLFKPSHFGRVGFRSTHEKRLVAIYSTNWPCVMRRTHITQNAENLGWEKPHCNENGTTARLRQAATKSK